MGTEKQTSTHIIIHMLIYFLKLSFSCQLYAILDIEIWFPLLKFGIKYTTRMFNQYVLLDTINSE